MQIRRGRLPVDAESSSLSTNQSSRFEDANWLQFDLLPFIIAAEKQLTWSATVSFKRIYSKEPVDFYNATARMKVRN